MKTLSIPTRTDLPADFSRLSGSAAAGAIFFHWAVIASSVALAVAYPGVPTFVLNLVLVGTRQHALFLVMHEGTHYLLSKNRRWNDVVSDLFAAWPVGMCTARYRVRHWLHHRYLNGDQDPDWARKKNDPSWQFPTSPTRFWKTTLPYLFGKGVIEMTLALRAFGVRGKPLVGALPFYAGVAAALTYTHGWSAFALYWLVPYVSLNPVLHRFRYSAEHMALPRTHALNGTRNVVCRRWEGFLISPMDCSLHLVHHTYPFIPWYHLRKAHAFLHQNPAFHENAYELPSYFPLGSANVYGELTAKTSPSQPASGSRAA